MYIYKSRVYTSLAWIYNRLPEPDQFWISNRYIFHTFLHKTDTCRISEIITDISRCKLPHLCTNYWMVRKYPYENYSKLLQAYFHPNQQLHFREAIHHPQVNHLSPIASPVHRNTTFRCSRRKKTDQSNFMVELFSLMWNVFENLHYIFLLQRGIATERTT